MPGMCQAPNKFAIAVTTASTATVLLCVLLLLIGSKLYAEERETESTVFLFQGSFGPAGDSGRKAKKRERAFTCTPSVRQARGSPRTRIPPQAGFIGGWGWGLRQMK